jgi:hypothetical protein
MAWLKRVKDASWLNNQPDALIIQILFCHKALHVSGIFSAHHQELSSFLSESGWNCCVVTLLGSGHQACMKRTNAECTVDSSWWWAEKMPEICGALWQNKIWIICAYSWLFNYGIYHDARPHECKVKEILVRESRTAEKFLSYTSSFVKYCPWSDEWRKRPGTVQTGHDVAVYKV